MDDRLVALDGSPDVPLHAALVVIGRHPSCDVCIDSVRISRVHCCIYRDGKKFFVRDLNSTNGVRINGLLVTDQAQLHDGDLLTIANLRYRRQSSAVSHADQSRLSDSPAPRHDMNTPVVGDVAPEIAANIDLSQVSAAVRQAIPAHLAGQFSVEVNLRLQKPHGPIDSPAPKVAT